MPTDVPAPSVLSRLLRPISEVRAHEAPRALAMLVSLFILMIAYYLLKTVREPLILAAGGAELKSYAAGLQALVLIGFVPAYGWLTRRVGRRGLIIGLVGFFFGCLQLFYFALKLGLPYVGIAFFVWVGIFSLSVIAQFWSLANDLYAQEEGERLFPLIAFGATLGSPIGARIAETLFARGLSPATMLQLAAALLVMHGALTLALVSERGPQAAATAADGPITSRNSGFSLILRSPYLRLVVVLLVLLNLVNTVGEYVLAKNVVAAAAEAVRRGQAKDSAAFIGHFYGGFFFWVNVVAALMQAFLVSRLVKHGGIRAVLLFLPLLAFGVYGAIASGVGFIAVQWLKTAENATDYSVMNTGRAMMWLPTTREEKYRAKQTADTFFVRIGDVLSTGLVLTAVRWRHLGPGTLAAMNAAIALGWIVVAWQVARKNGELAQKREQAAALESAAIVAPVAAT
jgi:AAA family ATP:ADP antiporter